MSAVRLHPVSKARKRARPIEALRTLRLLALLRDVKDDPHLAIRRLDLRSEGE